jgi:hypothetical protein
MGAAGSLELYSHVIVVVGVRLVAYVAFGLRR